MLQKNRVAKSERTAIGYTRMTDRRTKVLWAVIALGLWANVITPLFRPAPVAAQSNTLTSIDDHLAQIENELHKANRNVGGQLNSTENRVANLENIIGNVAAEVTAMSLGICRNKTLCPNSLAQ